MGVPGFFAWLRRKYPQIVDDSAKLQGIADGDSEDNACDNLYIGIESMASALDAKHLGNWLVACNEVFAAVEGMCLSNKCDLVQ